MKMQVAVPSVIISKTVRSACCFRTECLDFQNRLFHRPKQAVSGCETGHIESQKGPLTIAKRHTSEIKILKVKF